MKQKHTFLLVVMFLTTLWVQAQPPAGYYDTATGTGYALKTQLYNIIKNHTVISYSSLYSCYQGTYNGNATDKKSNGKVWDMYSDIPGGTPPYEYGWSQTCGSYSNEGDCFNREHTFPQSWFSSASPMQSDLFHVYPTDGKVNGIRDNYPYGNVSTPTKTTLNGSKLGPCSYAGYTGTVFEPIDEYKGDFARNYFYMATRYENLIAGWQSNGNADQVLNGTSDQVFDTWQLNLLYDWHTQDPVSQKEIDRNNAVYTIQGNRNPYIDHPEWVGIVWGFSAATPAVSFSAATSTTQEPAAGTITYTVNVSANTTANNPFSVNISVDGAGTTALSPDDYTLSTTSLTFSGSQTLKQVQITIQSDGTTETDETIKLVLSSPTNGMILGTNASHTITLRDVSALNTISETFDPCDNLNTWKQYSKTGAQTWVCTTFGRNSSNGAQMNGFSGSAIENEDWLISPATNVGSSTKVSYWSRVKFAGNSLVLKISSNYTGSGDPTAATWTDVPGATFPAANSDVWTETANVDLSAYAGSNRYLAFVYTSTSAEAARWTVDDITISGVATPSSTPVLLSSGTINDFGSIDNGQTSANQTFTVSGSDLIGDVTVEAPIGFQVSKDGISFSNLLVFVAGTDFTLPTMTNKTVYVRFAPTSGIDGTKDGDITIASASASPLGIYLSGTETGNGAAIIEFTEISSQAPIGQGTYIKLSITPAVKRLTNITLKATLLNDTSTEDFSLSSNLASDATFVLNIPAGATETAFSIIPTTDNQNKGVEFSINAVGIGLEAGAQSVNRANFSSPTALDNYLAKTTNIYPNPAKEVVYINSVEEINNVQVKNILGQTLQSYKGAKNMTINTQALADGLYILEFSTPKGNFVKKIVVRK